MSDWPGWWCPVCGCVDENHRPIAARRGLEKCREVLARKRENQ